MNMLNELQKLMKKEKIDYYIVPTDDDHQSENVGEYFQARKYLSGFTGSAGTLLVTQKEAFLWTDGRYFIQAAKELRDDVKLMKMNTEGYPIVIAGDFNVTPNNSIVTDFNGVMKNATQHAESVDTHESYNDWGERLLTLDYIFYDGFTKCHSYDVVTEEYSGKPFISDHYPVTAEFTF